MHHIRIPLFLALMLITPAFAHAEFESSDPADGSVLDTTPQSVTLTFTEGVDTKFSTFKVYKLDDPELIDELASDHAADHSDGESEDDHHSGDASPELSGFVETVTTAREDSDSRVDTGLSATERKVSEVVMPLQADLPTGHYLIMWRVLADDTHVISGFTSFEIAAG